MVLYYNSSHYYCSSIQNLKKMKEGIKDPSKKMHTGRFHAHLQSAGAGTGVFAWDCL